MLPLGHLSFAYLSYVGYLALTRRRLPRFVALFPLAFGSQFPDLIDKPGVFYGVLPSGRSFGHSLLTAVVFVAVVFWLARQPAVRRLVVGSADEPADQSVEAGGAADGGLVGTTWRERLLDVAPMSFSVGYLSHLVGDSYGTIVAGDVSELSFLLYPVLPAPLYESDEIAPWIRLLNYYAEPRLDLEFGLVVLAGLLFVGTIAFRFVRSRE